MNKEDFKELSDFTCHVCSTAPQGIHCPEDENQECPIAAGFAEELAELVNQKVAKAKKEIANEFWKELGKVINEGWKTPQPGTAISSPFINGEQTAYKIIYLRMKEFAEKYGVEV